MVKTGFIRRHSLETFLTMIEGIVIDQDILGRIFNYGSIIVTGTGGTKEPFQKVKSPLKFRTKVQEQIEAIQISAS